MSLSDLKNKYEGQTAWIIGKGKSLANLKKSDIGEGFIIAMNSSILKIEELGFVDNVYTIQKDGGHKRKYDGSCHLDPVCDYAGSCPEDLCGDAIRPKTATLFVHDKESLYCFEDYSPRYVFNWEELGLNGNSNSMVCAVLIAQLMGCKHINFVSCDSFTHDNYDMYDPHYGVTKTDHLMYLTIKKSITPFLETFSHDFITPEGEQLKGRKKLGYFIRDNGACGYYRMALPLGVMGVKSDWTMNSFKSGDTADKIFQSLDSDVIVVPRVVEDEFISVIDRIKATNKKLVLDYDDNLFCVSPFSAAYEYWGTKEITINHNGEELPMWVDKYNAYKYAHHVLKPNVINIEENKKKLEALTTALMTADMVTVTQPKLAEAYWKYNSNIVCLPNCVDLNLWKKPDFKEHEEIRVYWSGGSSHYEDWCLLAEVMPKIIEKYPQVKLVLMGMKFDGTLKEIPQAKIEFHPWVDTLAYPYKTALLNPDICVIPLVDNEFNRGKSNIKWVEMGALEVPCVTSYVTPYKEHMTDDNGIFIENNDKDGWIDGISMLIEDKSMRLSMAESAHQTVRDNFDINKEWKQWENAYRSLL